MVPTATVLSGWFFLGIALLVLGLGAGALTAILVVTRFPDTPHRRTSLVTSPSLVAVGSGLALILGSW